MIGTETGIRAGDAEGAVVGVTTMRTVDGQVGHAVLDETESDMEGLVSCRTLYACWKPQSAFNRQT